MSTTRTPAHFRTVAQLDVPHSRNGKHKKIVTMILRDLDQLKDGAAIRVPLSELGDSKENVRSALNRATRKTRRNVATATDDDFLYIWNVAKGLGL
jgi:sirohydrochlorin ferrochelatase